MMPFFRACARAVLELLFPRKATCLACGSRLGNDRDDVCNKCREELVQNWVGPRMLNKKLKIDGAAFAHPYRGPAGSLVRHLKYGAVWILAEEMGKELAQAVSQLRIAQCDICTAVPMHPRRMRVRGKNHAELLSQVAANALGIEYAPLLMRTRNAPQQVRLDAANRRKNLKDAFAVKPEYVDKICGREVLLIDDVLTTGGTALACAEALRAAGVRRVWFAAYCVGGQKKRNG